MLKRVIVGSVLAAGLVAAAPAGAATSPAAQASGGDPVPPLPSLVQTRMTRVENALERLTEDVDEVNGVHAMVTAKVVRRQLAAAWRGARYYITHPPAPPADDARVHSGRHGVRVRDLAPKVRAKLTQDDEALTIADPVTTAMAVFDEFHTISSTAIELTDGARVPVPAGGHRHRRRERAGEAGAGRRRGPDVRSHDARADPVPRRRDPAHRRPDVGRDRSAARRQPDPLEGARPDHGDRDLHQHVLAPCDRGLGHSRSSRWCG
jgi:hypothetical protein